MDSLVWSGFSRGSPFWVDVESAAPIVAYTILLITPVEVEIDNFGQFYLQNISDPDDPTQLLLPVLDASGIVMLHCPESCGGQDPGYGSFRAAFVPKALGRWKVEIQYCDPKVNGLACDQEEKNYDLALQDPPQPPNPCTLERAGEKGGARKGVACSIEGMSFETVAVPLQVVIATSDLAPIEKARPGVPYTITINATSAPCEYLLEGPILLRGNCTLDPATLTFFVTFTFPTTGTYFLSVSLSKFTMAEHPLKFSVETDYTEYDGAMSSVVGMGHAIAGEPPIPKH
ncbi:hypothetical protein T484DRAFT_1767031 [Baffinella frigidus]|nr:hypothetical protein T484DRAFT_1767031 [Cryptophyta sp. CCMP2293]